MISGKMMASDSIREESFEDKEASQPTPKTHYSIFLAIALR
jgi:hypothetical protein